MLNYQMVNPVEMGKEDWNMINCFFALPLWKIWVKVSWDDDIPNIWKSKKCSKPPTRQKKYVGRCFTTRIRFQKWFHMYSPSKRHQSCRTRILKWCLELDANKIAAVAAAMLPPSLFMQVASCQDWFGDWQPLHHHDSSLWAVLSRRPLGAIVCYVLLCYRSLPCALLWAT